jgi:hypothetical protein
VVSVAALVGLVAWLCAAVACIPSIGEREAVGWADERPPSCVEGVQTADEVGVDVGVGVDAGVGDVAVEVEVKVEVEVEVKVEVVEVVVEDEGEVVGEEGSTLA